MIIVFIKQRAFRASLENQWDSLGAKVRVFRINPEFRILKLIFEADIGLSVISNCGIFLTPRL